MAVLYKPSPFAYYTDAESLTEQEHAESCDINKMIRDVHRGLDVRGGNPGVYGYDDTTMDAVQHRILKQQTEEELHKLARENEYSEEELQSMQLSPEQKQKFGFKVRKKAQKDVSENDDKTTKPETTQELKNETPVEPKK